MTVAAAARPLLWQQAKRH